MTLLKDAIEGKKFDSRIVENNLSRGVVTPDELKKHRGGLQDDELNGEWVNVDEIVEDEPPRKAAKTSPIPVTPKAHDLENGLDSIPQNPPTSPGGMGFDGSGSSGTY